MKTVEHSRAIPAADPGSTCSRCGAPFHCAVASGSPQPCWCTQMPAAVPLPAESGAGCWCPACLRQQIDALTGGLS